MRTAIKYFNIWFPASHVTLYGDEVLSILATQSEGQGPAASTISGSLLDLQRLRYRPRTAESESLF